MKITMLKKLIMNVDPRGVQCLDSVVRKDEEPVNIDFKISEIQISFYHAHDLFLNKRNVSTGSVLPYRNVSTKKLIISKIDDFFDYIPTMFWNGEYPLTTTLAFRPRRECCKSRIGS